jgi:hypothetical protein
MKLRKLHYPIISSYGSWGLKPLCRWEPANAIYALNVAETTCGHCLRMIAQAQNRVEEMRKAIWGEANAK